jgi:hypothetical protein
MKKYRKYILIGLLAILVIAVALTIHASRIIPPAPGSAATPSVAESYWKERIHAVGGVRAYAEFAESVSNFSPQMQHKGSHAFGGALYDVEGAQGLSVCDSRFSFGCFHEFLGRAITDLGLDSVTQLNQGCVDQLGRGALSCQHGIGHGVLAAIGYDRDDLMKALEICKDLPFNDPIGGCYGGVYMEYNMQTMLGEEGRARPATNDLAAPCDSLPDPYAAACYFWQAQWWRRYLRDQGIANNLVAYARIGQYCAQAPAQYARNCYEGIGNNIPPDADFDGDRTRALCEATSDNATDRLYCKSYAANSLFVGGAGKKGDALAVCADLPDSEYRYCVTYANNKANIAAPLMIKSETTRE